MILYTYAFSSAAFRVRIALNLKGIAAEHRFVHLRKDGGQHLMPAYAALNPMREVPTLMDGDRVIGQSMAILEYLEEVHPTPSLLPPDPFLRAKVRQVCESVVSGIHPLGNLKVMQYLASALGQDPTPANSPWYHLWVGQGLDRLEQIVTPLAGKYTVGDAPSFADCCVIPQVYNAYRNKVDISGCKTLIRLWEARQAEAPFVNALPERQPDAK